MTSTLPYGTWPSPISAADLASASTRVAYPQLVGDEVWWLEARPAEAGRVVVVAASPDNPVDVRDLLPAPWSARTRVHEYGGLCFLGYDAGGGQGLIFTEWTDQRLYRLGPGDSAPVALTPAPTEPAGLRYADLVLDLPAGRVLAVRESHEGATLRRSIVAIPLDASAADNPAAVVELAAGSHFLANPRLSPDRQRLAWLGWDHPNMPWDGTSLVVAELDSDGIATRSHVVLGGPEESISQAEWATGTSLWAVSDRTGWWNLYEVGLDDAGPRPLRPVDEEHGAPLWQLGAKTFAPLRDGRLAVLHGLGALHLGVLDPATGTLTDVDTPYDTWGASLDTDGTAVVDVAASLTNPAAVVRVDTSTGITTVVRTPMTSVPDFDVLPEGRHEVFTGPEGREVHTYVYPPRNGDLTGPDGEAPPYVVFVHGGPTGHSPLVLDPAKAYFTSRGIGVIDVNYGGSTGYGREYRNRLRRQWGVVDVEDAVAAAEGLAASGAADPARLAIRGGSAGGWTTLCALVGTSTFACGTSLFGVADLEELVRTTHDFESSYVEKLVGDLPEDRDVFVARSPLTHAEDLAVPVLLLQGLDDPIVPPAQAELFAAVLVRKGVPHAYLGFPGEQHGFRQAANIQAAYEAELSFYGQVMGFVPPGVPVLELRDQAR